MHLKLLLTQLLPIKLFDLLKNRTTNLSKVSLFFKITLTQINNKKAALAAFLHIIIHYL